MTNRIGFFQLLAASVLLRRPELITPMVSTRASLMLSRASTPPHEKPAAMILLASTFL